MANGGRRAVYERQHVLVNASPMLLMVDAARVNAHGVKEDAGAFQSTRVSITDSRVKDRPPAAH